MQEFDPAKIIVTFNGVLLNGFMSGTFLTAERTSDSFEDDSGADGKPVRIRKRDKRGTVTLTFQAESLANDVLSAAVNADELLGTGYGILQVQDLNGRTVLLAAQAWVRKPASVEYSDGANGREWMLACAQLDMKLGGANSLL